MKVKVGIAQMSCVADKQQNIARYTEKVRQLAAEGAQIVCLQELFASLYFCDEERYENFKLAEPIPEGPTCQHFMALAKELSAQAENKKAVLRAEAEAKLSKAASLVVERIVNS